MIDHRELDYFCDFLSHDWQLDRSESHRHFARKTCKLFWRWSYFSEFDAHPIESVTEDNIDRASRVNEHSSEFQISYDEIYDEQIAVRLIDPAGFLLREGD